MSQLSVCSSSERHSLTKVNRFGILLFEVTCSLKQTACSKTDSSLYKPADRVCWGVCRPVNLPPGVDATPHGIAAAMARSHSYDWVLAAAEAPETDEEEGALAVMTPAVGLRVPIAAVPPGADERGVRGLY